MTFFFNVELCKVMLGFMNSFTINNNHIYILVMGYTTPETSKGVDMTFWGMNVNVYAGDGSNIFVEAV